MQTATVFSYDTDFTEHMKDLFDRVVYYLRVNDHYPVIDFPLWLESNYFEGQPVAAQEYFDLLIEIKTRMLYGTTLALVY